MPNKYIDMNLQAFVSFSISENKVCASKNERKKWPTASLIKLIIVYQTLEAIHQKRILLKTKVFVHPLVASLGSHLELADIPMKMGETYTIYELIQMILLISENQPALQLMITLFNDLASWQASTHELLLSMGITANISNPTGLDYEDIAIFFDKQSMSDTPMLTSLELLQLTQQLVRDFPEVLLISQQKHMTIKNQIWINRNPKIMSPTNGITWQGLKTGYTVRSGQNLIGVVTKQNRQYIVILLGYQCDDKYSKYNVIEKIIKEVDS
ncbi:serine hydrolase [Leuconostoc gelidum]|uniref:serine hydrolase n=1 Tax=Leuconostoc gelidum TaxID=1244 RepID=UPI001C7CAAAC|nr:serine hydrolase [Leuconostoc gelidum]MBZ6010835.1 D-alanyl-D-alanine carboxypeptidase [Leuconostoc gelidum subsp. aenigmaticum]